MIDKRYQRMDFGRKSSRTRHRLRQNAPQATELLVSYNPIDCNPGRSAANSVL